jgi:cobyric acid synthase
VRHNQCFRQSLLATALTPWYSRQELKVAAFKAQNMINNARVANGTGKVNCSAIVIVSMQFALRSSILREVIKWRISTQEQKGKELEAILVSTSSHCDIPNIHLKSHLSDSSARYIFLFINCQRRDFIAACV